MHRCNNIYFFQKLSHNCNALRFAEDVRLLNQTLNIETLLHSSQWGALLKNYYNSANSEFSYNVLYFHITIIYTFSRTF